MQNNLTMSADSTLALPTSQQTVANAPSTGSAPDLISQQLLVALTQLNQSGQLDFQHVKQAFHTWRDGEYAQHHHSQSPSDPSSSGTPSQPTPPPPTSSTGGSDPSANNPPPTSSTGSSDPSANNPQPAPSTGGPDPSANNPPPTSSTGGSDPSANNPPPAPSTGGSDPIASNPQPSAPDSGSSSGGSSTPAPAPVSSGVGAGSVAAPTTSGPSYYVSPTGNDSNSGTSAGQAFQSIQSAVNAANGQGGTIYLEDGTYKLNDAVKIDSSHGGTQNQHLVITNADGAHPILDGSGIPQGWFNGNITLDHAKYVDINGIETKNGNYGIQGWGAQNTTVTNSIVHDNYEGGIAFLSPNALNGESANDTVSGNTVYHNETKNNHHDNTWASAIMMSRTDNAVVTHNNVYENQGEGIDFALVRGFTATDNVSHDNYSVNLYMDNATNGDVERNTLNTTGNPTYFRELYGTQGPGYGMAIANESYEASNPAANITIKNNDVENNVVDFLAGDDLNNVTVDSNTFKGGTWDVVDFNGSNNSNSSFTHNTVTQTVAGKPVTDPGHVGKFTNGINFSGNTWSGDGASGLN